MEKLNLNGVWQMKILGENIYHIENEYMEANVPGSVYGTLMEQNKIPDVFYQDNELNALKLMENDFIYQKQFEITEEFMKQDALMLHFDGIDTIGDIFINDKLIGNAINMHRIWEFEIKKYLNTGNNELKVVLHSPTKYIKDANKECYAGGSKDCMEGYPHLRKAHCMFGWDWGPRLPDAGIWRDVCILGITSSRFDNIYITQIHKNNEVILDFDVAVELVDAKDDSEVKIKVTSPDGIDYYEGNDGKITIQNPHIWWPNGYGEQPLYMVSATLISKAGDVLDTWEKKIGLRTISLKREKDEWGESFEHVVNNVSIFAMGANYIPEDNVLSRITEKRTRQLLEDCVAAHYNIIRVWGGGYYPDDYFYDICDELGLLVWQDFMYACADYELTDEFEKNIRQETIENVIRIRHHASLALWCGNNEMETQVLDKCYQPSEKQKYDYIKIFEYIIPKIVKKYDPHTFYWPSSPSAGGNFDNPWDYNKGDTHYWDVWHGNKPFSEYRKFFFRYASEFGFQSFPSVKTIETFTEEEDRNIFSRIMEMHQRNVAANGKILNYISDNYLYPKDFELLIYTSQLLQADAIRYGVEHWRRNRGRCMGAIVWQLNDIWPVASWSSIDYFGRWKALHYYEKRFFAPIMISCNEIGEMTERPHCIEEPHDIEKSATLNVANETRENVTGLVKWTLRNEYGTILKKGEEEVQVPALTSVWLDKIDFTDCDEFRNYFSYEILVDDKYISGGTCIFTAPKHFHFKNPNLTYKVEGDTIIIKSESYAKSIEIESVDEELKLSDNYFDMNPGEVSVKIIEGNAKKLKLRSVYDIAH